MSRNFYREYYARPCIFCQKFQKYLTIFKFYFSIRVHLDPGFIVYFWLPTILLLFFSNLQHASVLYHLFFFPTHQKYNMTIFIVCLYHLGTRPSKTIENKEIGPQIFFSKSRISKQWWQQLRIGTAVEIFSRHHVYTATIRPKRQPGGI